MKDRYGNVIKVGDFIAVAYRIGNGSEIDSGKVVIIYKGWIHYELRTEERTRKIMAENAKERIVIMYKE